ncbi:MAG: HD domain-containing protein, partial [Nanoarchaeota archaeon]|nr:HD domain-containing protein [Nanoarchaeota archaeon]
IGAYGKAKQVIDVLSSKNPSEFDSEKKDALSIAALLHDLGHSPFSHQIEPILIELFDKNHNKVTSDYAARYFTKLIEEKNINSKLVMDLLEKKHPMHIICNDMPLGIDKLDYIERDSYYLHIKGTPSIEKIISHLVYVDGKLGIEEKGISEVINLMNHYFKLHNEAYLCKPSLINQRMLQRAVQESIDFKDFDPREMWDMTDSDLIAKLKSSTSKIARELYGNIEDGINFLYKSSVVMKIEGHENVEKIDNKSIAVFGVNSHLVNSFTSKYKNPLSLKNVEDSCAEMLGLSEGDVLIGTVSYFGRLEPPDVNILMPGTEKFYSLFETHEEESKTLQRMYKDAFAIRIVTKPEYRTRVFEAATEIRDLIISEINNNCNGKD